VCIGRDDRDVKFEGGIEVLQDREDLAMQVMGRVDAAEIHAQDNDFVCRKRHDVPSRFNGSVTVAALDERLRGLFERENRAKSRQLLYAQFDPAFMCNQSLTAVRVLSVDAEIVQYEDCAATAR
jgi:hypothetical protein